MPPGNVPFDIPATHRMQRFGTLVDAAAPANRSNETREDEYTVHRWVEIARVSRAIRGVDLLVVCGKMEPLGWSS